MNEIFHTVTADQFKAYYFRDFPYLPYYNSDKTYFKGDVVFNDDDCNFYKSKVDNNTAALSNTTNWEVTKDDVLNYITDMDIEKAIGQATLSANEDFGNSNEEKIMIFLHLVAFYLCLDMKNAATGVNSSYAGLVSSKSVGSVSESYNFPQWVVNSPMYSLYSQNGYGMKYLSLIIPYLSCTVLFSTGRTTIG